MFGTLNKSLVFCAFLIGPLVSYGQTPSGKFSEKPKQQAVVEQSKPASIQHGTEQSPLFIKILPSSNTIEKPIEIPKNQGSEPAINWLPSPEIWMVTFTCGLFGATLLLWWATRALVKGAERTAKMQLRAYVGCQNVSMLDRPIRGQVAIKNFGQTMARNVEIRLATAVQTVGSIQFVLDEIKSRTVIMPGEVAVLEEKAGQYDSGLVNQGMFTIYVWGRVDYEDVFEQHHWTTFRFENDGIRGTDEATGIALPSWKVKVCLEGNSAD